MPTKKVEFLENIRGLSDEDLLSKEQELKTKLYKLKFSNALTPIENPVQFRYIKKDIARVKTETQKRKNLKSTSSNIKIENDGTDK